MKRLRLYVAVVIALALIGIGGVVYYVLLGQWHVTSYAAGKTNLVKVYAPENAGGHSAAEEDPDAENAGAAVADEDISGADGAEEVNADEGDADAGAEDAASDADAGAEDAANDADAGAEDAANDAANEGIRLREAGYVVRGSEVTSYLRSVISDGVTYRKVRSDSIVYNEDFADELRRRAAEEAAAEEQDDGHGADGDTETAAADDTQDEQPDTADNETTDDTQDEQPDTADDAAAEDNIDELLKGIDLYIADESLAQSADETVLEREVYVRTPATIYNEAGAPDIASFAPKGTRLAVVGYDRLLENGYINMYKVRYRLGDGGIAVTDTSVSADGDSADDRADSNSGSGSANAGDRDTGADSGSADAGSANAGDRDAGAENDGNYAEGYVYGKYMTDTQESADAPYNEHGEYDTAADDGFRFELYGGKAKDLDFYPYERTSVEGNEFCTYARAMYLNAEAAVHPDEYVKLIKASGCNAVVIDLKDGPLTYASEVARELSPSSYKAACCSMDDLRNGVEAYREAGVYLIGRIVTFNDTYYAKDHPEDCIKYGGSAGWPSTFSRRVWEYNVKLAQEAVREFGFNEIQFDYVRFPESTYEMSKSGKADFRNTYGESKAQAVQNFCFYAADQLRESGAYISVDVFGESAYSYVTAYGQYWTAISNIVDAISAMPYTDHFSGDKPWEDPYGSVRRWAKRAGKQQKRLQSPAAARTWITGYNTPHWAPDVDYNEERLRDQIRALEDSGLTGGFIPWNVFSDLNKYHEYQGIWAE